MHISEIDVPAVVAFGVSAAGKLKHSALKRGGTDIGKPLQIAVESALGTTGRSISGLGLDFAKWRRAKLDD